ERGQPVGRSLRLQERAEQALLNPAAQLTYPIARHRGPLGEGIRAPERVVSLPCLKQGVDDVDLERDVELARGHERGGALEQADGGAVVLTEVGSVAAGGQAASRRRSQHPVVRRSELGAVAAGLLEVVAEDLVQLDELGA